MSASKKLIQASGGAAGGPAYVFVAGRENATVSSIDVSDSSNMSVVDSVSGTARYRRVRDVAVDADREYLFTGSDGDLSVVDISDPENLSELANKPGSSRFDEIEDIKFYKDGSGDNAVLGASRLADGIWVNEANDAPLDLDDESSVGAIARPFCIELDADNNYVYVTSLTGDYIKRIGWPSIYSLNSGDVTQLNLTTDSTPRGLAIDTTNGYLYVAEGGPNQISSIDLSNFASGGISSLSDATNLNKPVACILDEENSVLYAIVENGDGVTSIDISDPTSMSVIDYLSSVNMENASNAVLNDDKTVLFVVSLSGNITAVDVSDTSNLSEISSLSVYAGELNGIDYFKPAD